MDDHLLNAGEVAAHLGIPTEIIERAIEIGAAPTWQSSGIYGERYWSSSQFSEWREMLDVIDFEAIPAEVEHISGSVFLVLKKLQRVGRNVLQGSLGQG